MNDKSIGLRIRRQREFLGLTREELAEHLDVSVKFCADIELGNRGMSMETLCKLTQVLHLSSDYILFGKSGSNPETESLVQLVQSCSPEQLPYLTGIVQNFLAAVERRSK